MIMASVALQSRHHRDLLDIIDRLRSNGTSRYVDLPQIVVCGDQSAGKSSVLESISGMSFPSKDNLCTRFATELVLRRHVKSAVKISIIPGPDCSAEDRERLSKFNVEVNIDALDIGSVIEKAKEAMGLSETKVFSSDVLRVELCGPSQPHLTMVDLPGLFRAGNRDQSVQDAQTVRNLVLEYVKRPRSIILAVVSAKSDFALQEITQMARELDPEGIRTLGLITKPDALDVGSDSEASYVKLAQNNDVVFRLGWHVLKNRDFKMRDASSAERDEAEARFFASGIWTTLDPSHLGVESLKLRLSNVLKDQILQQLPDLLDDVEKEISTCSSRLERLGTPRSTAVEQRKYLLQVSRDFTLLMKAAVDGEYNNPFFGNAKSDEGYKRRLRARVQNILTKFEGEMRLKGQQRTIVDDASRYVNSAKREVARSSYINEVKELMERSRGRELSGTFNPLIVGELFSEQCQPWAQLAAGAEKEILQAVDEVAHEIVNHVTVKETATAILYLLKDGTDRLKKELGEKLKELLQPHSDGHPITYNHYLTETVQKAQAERRKLKLEQTFEKSPGGQVARKGHRDILDFSGIMEILQTEMEVDMQQFGSELAFDYMEAYYKVAMKKFIDDVSVLAVERCLINKLPNLFQAESVLDLTDEEIARMAGETAEAATERESCTEKLAILQAGRSALIKLATRGTINSGDPSSPPVSKPSEGAAHESVPHKQVSTGPSNETGAGCSSILEAAKDESAADGCDTVLVTEPSQDQVYDDDAHDMKEAGLFMRDWRIVGTEPPRSAGSDSSEESMVAIQHFNMLFEEDMKYDNLEGSEYKNKESGTAASGPGRGVIVLNPMAAVPVELIPVSRSSLGRYYEYFSRNVAMDEGDLLMNVCEIARKSPCFDIRNCYLVRPSFQKPRKYFTVVEAGDDICIPLVPTSAIDAIRNSLVDIGISVVPSMHDAYAFNGCRIRVSKHYTSCEIAPSEWKGNTYTPRFNRMIECTAVTTATFTVSAVLGIVYGSTSHYNYRKTLTIVIHAIK
ncbi:hypothetical protein E4U55_002563 [Claviceps digitariae]|nr:hypothetical protein E4U55_002563 [Claviceps digitariae]